MCKEARKKKAKVRKYIKNDRFAKELIKAILKDQGFDIKGRVAFVINRVGHFHDLKN